MAMHDSASMKTSTNSINIALIGAGISGLALTIRLLKYSHIQVTIYESSPGFDELGAGIGFGRNATSAMKLIDPRIYDGLLKVSTEGSVWFDYRWGMKSGTFDSNTGNKIVQDQLLLKQSIHEEEDDISISTVHRKEFLDILVRLIPPGTTVFNKRATTFVQSDSKVQIYFQDGTIAEADAVIGCDGVRSITRKYVFGGESPFTQAVYSGKYCYRGLADMKQAKEVLGEAALERQMFLGRGGHVLTFPIENEKTLNIVAMQTAKNGKWDHSTWTRRVPKEEMLKDFESRCGTVAKILDLYEDNVLQWALFDHIPSPTFSKGSICLMGDAAHACTPHAGAGAGQALEDAFILSQLLGLCKTPISLTNAFFAYETVRVPRTKEVIEKSRARGRLLSLDDDVYAGTSVDLDEVERALSGDLGMQWIWDIDLEAELERARAVFEGKETGDLGV